MSNIITLLVGESGSGKTSISEELSLRYGLKCLQSYTTRPPRYSGETGHTFITEDEMDHLLNNETIVGYTEFDGYRYCATSNQVDNNDLYIVDPAGVKYMFATYLGPKRIKVIYLHVDPVTRFERMMSRGDSANNAIERIEHDSYAFDRFKQSAFVDKVIKNNSLAKTVRKIHRLIKRWEVLACFE